jgi:hypothetical protein
MWRMAILGLAACGDPPDQAFVVDGFVNVLEGRGSVVGIWELAGTPVRHYKFGDGPTLDEQFSLGFATEPPPGALNPDGIGVAYVVMLPELTTVPDGPISLSSLPALGITSDGAIIYKAGDATGPAWSEALPVRFSCTQCIRDASLDRFALQPCASVFIERSTERCGWF